MKPLINLDDVVLDGSFEAGPFQQRYGEIASRIGARKLGYNLTVVAPGKRACPFHNHHTNEEMFFILEGQGVLRFGHERYPLRRHDIIACPPGSRDVAHQIENTGSEDLTYLALSTMEPSEIAEYPDSNKIGVLVGEHGNMDLRLFLKADQAVDYMEGEE
jgi:uncharacterized cupin superfamily protein